MRSSLLHLGLLACMSRFLASESFKSLNLNPVPAWRLCGAAHNLPGKARSLRFLGPPWRILQLGGSKQPELLLSQFGSLKCKIKVWQGWLLLEGPREHLLWVSLSQLLLAASAPWRPWACGHVTPAAALFLSGFLCTCLSKSLSCERKPGPWV